MSEVIRVGEKEFVCKFPDLLRPLTVSERAALKESIRRHGLLVPLKVVRGPGLSYEIIDGGNRAALLAELHQEGVRWPERVEVVSERDEEKLRELALSLNLDRRHLSQEERQQARAERIERVAEARRDGKSQRQIAREEGVSLPIIQDDIKKATDRGLSVEPADGKVKGLDGKERPAHRPATPPPASIPPKVGVPWPEKASDEGLSEFRKRMWDWWQEATPDDRLWCRTLILGEKHFAEAEKPKDKSAEMPVLPVLQVFKGVE